jgi:hypothetical protein
VPCEHDHVTYEEDLTGLLVLDPYNNFISEGGKVWDRLKDKRHGIHRPIVMGLIAHTCVEATFDTAPSSAMTSR